jgi:RNA chaperone Hfq
MNQQTLHLNSNRAHRNKGKAFHSKPKYEGKGHDALLREFIAQQQPIEIFSLSGERYTGKVVTADKYTITVEASSGTRYTVYKHAIETFCAKRTGE